MFGFINQTDKENLPPTLGLALLWLDELSLSICNSILLRLGLDGILFCFLSLSSSSVFQFGFSCGLTEF
jgi:hypothetical protein